LKERNSTRISNTSLRFSLSPAATDERRRQAKFPAAANRTIHPRALMFAAHPATPVPACDRPPTRAGQDTPVMIRLQFGALARVQSLAYFSCTAFLATWTYLVP